MSTKSDACAAGGDGGGDACAAASDVRHLFVYGTLRPDDISGASWTKTFSKGLRSEPAVLHDHALYLDDYCVVLHPPPPEEAGERVVGCVLSADSAEVFAAKIEEADEIEEVPVMYQRSVVRVQVLGKSSSVLGDFRNAYVYHRRVEDMASKPNVRKIPGGDYVAWQKASRQRK